MSEVKSFTGRRTRHQTRWGVRAADRISSLVITIGGIGTIVAVSLVFVVLVVVVWPLFSKSRISEANRATVDTGTIREAANPNDEASPLHLKIDPYQSLGWSLYSTGDSILFRADSGEVIQREKPLEKNITAIATTPGSQDILVAFADGSAQIGNVSFQTNFLSAVPEDMDDMKPGEVRSVEGRGVVQMTPSGQHRQQTISVEFGEPIQLADQSIRAIDRSTKGDMVALLEDGSVIHITVKQKRNPLSGETTTDIKKTKLDLASHGDLPPKYAMISGRGNKVFVVWEDGWLQRFDARTKSKISLAERLNLLEGRSDSSITALTMAIGKETLIVGDSEGYVTAWAQARTPLSESSDSSWLLPIHELPRHSAKVTSFGSSERSRILAAGYEDGHVSLFHVTTDQLLDSSTVDSGSPVTNLAIGAKEDSIFAVTEDGCWLSEFDPAYPEATWKSLFLPVWYEGFAKPELMWQSSSANVEAEMKLSLRPLIFGTLKATVYSMLFGAPLALLAAIYTSEFTHPRMRSSMKSIIEMMASLPSVILGFLAALVIAPMIADRVPSSLSMFVTVPIAILLGAYLWQQIPHRLSLRITWLRLPCIAAMIALGIFVGWKMGPWAERTFFDGNIFVWLDGQGDATGAWLLMLLPLMTVVIGATVILQVNPCLRRRSAGWSRGRFNFANLLKFVAATVTTLLSAWLISKLLVAVGFDPRGTFISTFDERNALIVGVVMGFAIIPIIYTIAEDALSTVPSHLRSASLGAGATPWQTAVRIVIPTAMSGLFSALMIGLGRAVGETMIVLMAAGNIPVMEWNLFNGFRTLSANIATEMPEAVENSTHYRTLFLAALTLFVLTFVVNTVAEMVRLQFRKRAVRL